MTRSARIEADFLILTPRTCTFDRIEVHVRSHIVIQGLVQGVGFRYFVYHHAVRLRVTGWVRNLFNGDVEIECEGERSELEIFVGELKIGPLGARRGYSH